MFNPIDPTLEMSLNVFITPSEGITFRNIGIRRY